MKATKASMGGDADKERYYGGIEDELGIILGAFSNVGLPKVVKTIQAPKPATPTSVSVNWTGRGLSTGKYPVLGHSQAGKYYVLDISTDANVTMPKRVSFADCGV